MAHLETPTESISITSPEFGRIINLFRNTSIMLWKLGIEQHPDPNKTLDELAMAFKFDQEENSGAKSRPSITWVNYDCITSETNWTPVNPPEWQTILLEPTNYNSKSVTNLTYAYLCEMGDFKTLGVSSIRWKAIYYSVCEMIVQFLEENHNVPLDWTKGKDPLLVDKHIFRYVKDIDFGIVSRWYCNTNPCTTRNSIARSLQRQDEEEEVFEDRNIIPIISFPQSPNEADARKEFWKFGKKQDGKMDEKTSSTSTPSSVSQLETRSRIQLLQPRVTFDIIHDFAFGINNPK